MLSHAVSVNASTLMGRHGASQSASRGASRLRVCVPASWNSVLHNSLLCSIFGCIVLARVQPMAGCRHVMCVCPQPCRPCTAPLLFTSPAPHGTTALLQVLRSQLLANRLLPEVSHAVVATQNAHAREGREEASIDLRQMERHFLSLVEVLAGQQ